VHAWTFQAREPGDPLGFHFESRGTFTAEVERSENVFDGNADMNAKRKSDESVVLATPANKGAAEAPAESAEERGSAERNAEQAALHRTQGRARHKSRGLHGVREAARKDGTLKFTALLHHVNEDCLREAFFKQLRGQAVNSE